MGVAACACTAYWTPLQTLDHAVANHAANCAHLIEAGGLKYLFPAFMGKVRGRLWLCARVRARVPWACPHGCRAGDQGSKKTAKMHGQSEVAAVEEHSVAIVASMFSLLPEDGVPRCVGGCSSGCVAVCEPPAEHAHPFVQEASSREIPVRGHGEDGSCRGAVPEVSPTGPGGR